MKSLISFTLSFSLIAFMVFLASCAKDKAAEPSGTIDTVDCIQPGQIITYTADIKKIMETYCTDESFGVCHQSELADTPGTPGLDYTNYTGIKEKAEDGSLINRVFNSPSNPMPPANSLGPTSLTDCEKLKLQTWVENNAPE